MSNGSIRSLGELLIQRPLDRREDGSYAPGQAAARIIDPRPHRDRADLAALLSFVDDRNILWDVTCMRYRDSGEWRPIKIGRYQSTGRFGNTHTAAALGYQLSAEHVAWLKNLAASSEPYQYEEPSTEEQSIRRLAHALVDRVQPS
jgi:hypothetical protein